MIRKNVYIQSATPIRLKLSDGDLKLLLRRIVIVITIILFFRAIFWRNSFKYQDEKVENARRLHTSGFTAYFVHHVFIIVGNVFYEFVFVFFNYAFTLKIWQEIDSRKNFYTIQSQFMPTRALRAHANATCSHESCNFGKCLTDSGSRK